MRNRIPDSENGLLAAIDSAAHGVFLHGNDLQMIRHPEMVIRAERTAAFQAGEGRRRQVQTVRHAYAALRGVVAEGQGFARLARELLKGTYGGSYSTAWNVAGFIGSLRVPRNAEQLLGMLETLARLFAAHPELEVAVRNITATDAQVLASRLCTARTHVEAEAALLVAAKAQRDEKFRILTLRLRALRKELDQVLAPLDGRWKAFGFNLPGASNIPEVPTEVKVVPVAPSAVSVKWASAARADHYRVWKRVVGVDPEWIAVGSPADLDFLLEGLPPNAEVEISVSAVNHGGESRPSAAVRVSGG